MKQGNWKLQKYNGWKNYYTWNVMLYLNNDEGYYSTVKAFRDEVKSKRLRATWTQFLWFSGLTYSKTPDGVAFNNKNLCRRELIQAIMEE